MANKRFYNALRLKAKAANERMRQLEKSGINSPAYQSVQARLAILGKPRKGSRGRRFSETGKATYNEMEKLDKILNDFLYGQETSTVKGAKEYMDNVWNSANKNNALDEAGISREDWLSFWESMPNKEKDRLYDSNESVLIIQAYSMKNGELSTENKYSMEEIADIIQTSKNLKDAYKKLNLNFKDIERAQNLGAL